MDKKDGEEAKNGDNVESARGRQQTPALSAQGSEVRIIWPPKPNEERSARDLGQQSSIELSLPEAAGREQRVTQSRFLSEQVLEGRLMADLQNGLQQQPQQQQEQSGPPRPEAYPGWRKDAGNEKSGEIENPPPKASNKKNSTQLVKDRVEENLQRNIQANKHTATEDPTSYLHTLIHLFKGNVGPGLFAMGFAFRNGGLVLSPMLTVLISLMCVNCQHMLLNCSKKMQDHYGLEYLPDFATTIELCFVNGPERCVKHATAMRQMVNTFIVITQLGFCCVYFVFVSSNIDQVFDANSYNVPIRILMVIIFVPICLTSLIRNFRYLAPVSAFASLCMVVALLVTIVIAFRDGFPSQRDRRLYADIQTLSVYYGTAIFAFEGIALVLPLKNSMEKPRNFDKKLGVLNIGMTFVTCLFITIGLIGYAKWGEAVEGSVTLNVGVDPSGQFVKSLVSLGVVFGYPLQFHIAIQIMFPNVVRLLKIKRRLKLANALFRILMVLVTLGMAELVPALEYFISFIGALCCTVLALVFPPIVDIIVHASSPKRASGRSKCTYIKNALILLCAVYGFVVGTYSSVYGLVRFFQEKNNYGKPDTPV